MTAPDVLASCGLTDVCTVSFPPSTSGTSPMVNWTCPTGTYITKFDVAPETTGSANHSVATIANIVCSNGTPVSGSAGYPSEAAFLYTVDCSGASIPGVGGLDVTFSSTDWSLTAFCADGTPIQFPAYPPGCDPPGQGNCAPPFWNNGGTPYGAQICNAQTHVLTGISATSSFQECTGIAPPVCNYTNVADISLTCSPLSEYCVNNNLNQERCISYCSANASAGVCDAALTAYCQQPANYNNPICGCSLSPSQYPLLNIPSYTGVAPPIACDQRCQNPSAIPLSNTGSCNVGVICIQEGIDITVLQSTVGSGITLSQNCSATTGGVNGTSLASFLTSTSGLMTIIAIVVLIIGIIIVILIANANVRRKQQEIKDQALRDEREQERLEQIKAVGVTVLRVS
jgi:hypothetical protein